MPTETKSPTTTPPHEMTAEEYIAWHPDEGVAEGGLVEWRRGKVVVHDMATEVHQRIVLLLSSLLLAFVGKHRLGRVIVAPYRMRVTPGGPIREPDVLYVAAEHVDRITPNVLAGPADLVVEVVSEDSPARDRAEKFDEYQEGSVAEYWVIDSRTGHERADFWVLDANGRYRAMPPSVDGVYHSSVLPGFRLEIDWLWQTDPDVWAMLGRLFTAEVE